MAKEVYKLLTGENNTALSAKVNSHIKEGYKPLGGPIVVEKSGYIHLYQAVTLGYLPFENDVDPQPTLGFPQS